MHIQLNNLHLRQGFRTLALSAVLGLSALGLSQCRMVGDAVTGVDTRSSSTYDMGRSSCEKQCNEAYKRCLLEEEQRHKVAKNYCKNLPPTQSRECAKAESRRHKSEKEACRTLKGTCKRSCAYREGSGNAGR